MANQPYTLTAWGETKTLAEWAADPRCAVTVNTLRGRYHRSKTLRSAPTPEQMIGRPALSKSAAGTLASNASCWRRVSPYSRAYN